MAGTKRKQSGGSLGLVEKERGKHAPRRLFLNPYSDMACTKCPKCDAKSKVRKFPLVIHIEPDTLFVLNKSCRCCEGCSLLIVRRSEVEALMAGAFEERNPAIIGNEYLVIGTLPRALWRTGQEGAARQGEIVEQTQIFEDQWEFEIAGGWTMDPKCKG